MNTTNLTADTEVVQMTHRNSPINQTIERRRLRVPKKGIIISQSKLQKRNNELLWFSKVSVLYVLLRNKAKVN